MSRMFEKSLFLLLALMAGTLFSCQRKAEEPVVSPGAGRGQVWFEVSERPMGGETKAVPATIATFTTSHESFGVVGYAYASDASSKDRERDTMQVSYVSGPPGRWEPANPVWYSFKEGKRLEFYAWYPYNTTTVPVTAPATINNTTHPTIAYTVPSDVAAQKDLMVAVKTGVTGVTDFPVQLTFSHKLTAVKFSIGVNTTCSRIKLSGIPGTGNLDMSTGEWPSVRDTVSYTINSPTFGDPDDNGQCLIIADSTLMLIPQTLPAGATLTAETSLGTITASLAGHVWDPGRVVTYKLTDPVFPFSVSATQKVRFSPGNLQYQASSGTWRFAQTQWNYVGDASRGNVYVGGEKCDNSKIGESYYGWIDLFGWGTSGHEFASGYGSSYQPWSTSTTDTDYGPTDGTFGLTGDYADGDWGSAVASTLGSGWRTLTKDEWVWLLGPKDSPTPGVNCRTSSTVNGTADARFATAYLFGTTRGLIIFPDSYTHPDGVKLPDGINAQDYKTFTQQDRNQFTEDEWTKMESAGCVFLPAAGSRGGTLVSDVGYSGFYWSSTPYGTDCAYSLRILYTSIAYSAYIFESAYRFRGYSVRLVQDL